MIKTIRPAASSRKQAGRKSRVSEALAKEMMEAGVHWGHRKSNWNPKMKPYIFGLRNNIHIIDLEKTAQELEKALEFIKKTIKKEGKILFIGTRPQSQNLVEEVAKNCKMPYVVSRWVGGLLTNFKNIRKRIEYLIELEKNKASGELKKYTKREQLKIDEQIEKLKKKFEGVKNLENLPEAILVLSVKEQIGAIREARRKKIPIIALVDTDSDPSLIDYPIPSNDDAVSVLKFMLDKIGEVIHPVKSREAGAAKQQFNGVKKHGKSTTSKKTQG
jgi:small subunit ribosomal protein S2